ncbi:hypothetical protein ONZ43_g216 [Nemania bipapillata]|uniref:Uncharacterized protein n=1 Tax=Nemania bipapillata TaxID=110536 RepID=A0ACC2J8Y1_9PEZI|nr:hypothetical protein ONZ43_g216 [Nemania bipapillata]
MRSILVSIIAFLAATSVAVPISSSGLGGATSPLTTVLAQAGKQVPPAMQRIQDSLHPKKNNTAPGKPGKPAEKKSDPLGGLTGLLGGIVPAGLVPGL